MTMLASADSTSTTMIPDFYTANNFWVELDGILQAYFTECNGMTVTTETFKVKEGGLNTHVHHLPERSSFTNITLKSGYTTSDVLWTWYKNTAMGKVSKKNVTIIFYANDGTGAVSKRWILSGAYPVKWTGPTLNAKANELMFESIELAYDFFQLSS
jgi:phage tail-like protein